MIMVCALWRTLHRMPPVGVHAHSLQVSLAPLQDETRERSDHWLW